MDEASYQLRPLQEEDLQIILDWRNSQRVRDVMYSDQIISWEEHQAWYHRTREEPTVMSMIFEYNKLPAGFVNFTRIHPVHRTAYWGFYLGQDELPKGTAYIMGNLALEQAFETLHLRKLCGEVFAFNSKSMRYHERLGFEREGLLREHFWKHGEFQDIVCYAIFQDHYYRKGRSE
jgi:UDP-4-amino-4,6-dideoxy-N-acetyl-beta-L-altrosamine N-acetyltransferase